jgi:hypothetical protein
MGTAKTYYPNFWQKLYGWSDIRRHMSMNDYMEACPIMRFMKQKLAIIRPIAKLNISQFVTRFSARFCFKERKFFGDGSKERAWPVEKYRDIMRDVIPMLGANIYTYSIFGQTSLQYLFK